MNANDLRLTYEVDNERMRPESAERIRQRLLEECEKAEEEREDDAEHDVAAVHETGPTHPPVLRSRRQVPPARSAAPTRRRRIAERRGFRIAACLALVLGTGMLSVAAPIAYETATHTAEKASAGSPLRPYQRIELDGAGVRCLKAEPDYSGEDRYDPDSTYQRIIEARLFLPGVPPEGCEVSIDGAPGVGAYDADLWAYDPGEPPEESRAEVEGGDGGLFNIAGNMEMDEERFEELLGDDSGFAAYDAEPAVLIDSLRGARLVVSAGGETETYRLDLGGLPDVGSIETELALREIRPIIIELVKESE